ncbi:hypothetical protein J2W97_002242 [Paenibacillus jamilae]|nr:hypothetical protein [Paenibacillus jamilae]
MTDQQLNVTLAELTGFPADKLTPNYCNDAAASLEVQAKAIEVSADKYVSNLDVIVNPDTIGDWTNDEIAKLLSATPRKRAEAAYMTLLPLREDI